MLNHPYYRSAKAEQREEAIEKAAIEAIRYLEKQQTRPITGRVLEALH
ncbi:hypothetical protein [Mesorhizobium sp. WSM2239]|uniref:Uncharacterized protein n=2 Tax=unclassified Mesorhizobium TaxID=325217 RepID=A0AAU8DE89_9HYPH